MNKEQIKQLQALCDKYALEANAYATELEGINKAYDALVAFDGIITRLIADIRSYELKHGDNGRLTLHKERLKEFELLRDVFWKTEGQNQKLKLILQKTNKKLFLALRENADLKEKVEGLTNAFNGL